MDLSSEEIDHLNNLINGGLMRKIIPSHVEQKFLQSGYARKAVGGLMPTEGAHKALMMWQKGSQK